MGLMIVLIVYLVLLIVLTVRVEMDRRRARRDGEQIQQWFARQDEARNTRSVLR